MRALTVLKTVPKVPLWLGLAGALPFMFGLIVAASGGIWIMSADFALRATVAYGAVILSFLGGVRWGMGLCSPTLKRVMRALRCRLSRLLSAGWRCCCRPFPRL